MTALLHDLGATDPGLLFAVAFIFGAVFGMVGAAMCLSWDSERGAR